MAQYEIEIKSLLGSKEEAEKLKTKLAIKGANMTTVKKSQQLNHYFTYSDLKVFYEKLLPYINTDHQSLFTKLITQGKNFSIRTRQSGNKVLLVIKASLDDQSSANGVSRMEFESEVVLSLEALDQLLLDSGLQYQAKWSRDREEYSVGDISVCIDKNAGYGYIAEFERVVDDQSKVDEVKQELLNFMAECEVSELEQSRLERMFSYYNEHWSEYYGSDNTFTVL